MLSQLDEEAAVASLLAEGHSASADVARCASAWSPPCCCCSTRAVAANLVPVAYLIPVIVAATQWGIWPATLASIASMAAADFFFFPPIYSFQVEDPQEAIDLLLFLVVALVSSNLASRLRRETETLRRREKEIQHLYEFSRRLAACFTVSDLISAIQNYLSRTLGQQAAFFVAMADGHFEPPKSGSVPKVVQESVASMIATIGVAARTIVDEPTQNVWLLRAVCSETAVHGLVAVNIGSGSRETIEIKTRRVEAILEEVSLTLQRLDIEKAMEDARLHLQAQLLRDAFHGTLSHELCSPLAAIRGSASVLDSMPADSRRRSDSLAGRGNLRRSRRTRRLHSKPSQCDAGYRRRRQPAPRMGRSEGHRQRGDPGEERDDWPHTRSRSNSPTICRWSMWIPA